MSDLRLRPLRWPADREPVRDIDATFSTNEVYDVHVDAAGFHLSRRRLPEPFTKEQRLLDERSTLGSSWEHAFVAEVDGRVRGLATTHLQRWNARQVLDGLYVDVSARRAGLARRLVDEVLGVAAGNHARQLWLETQNVNVPALAAYHRLGFVLVGCDTTLYGPPYEKETALYLARPVGR